MIVIEPSKFEVPLTTLKHDPETRTKTLSIVFHFE